MQNRAVRAFSNFGLLYVIGIIMFEPELTCGAVVHTVNSLLRQKITLSSTEHVHSCDKQLSLYVGLLIRENGCLVEI